MKDWRRVVCLALLTAGLLGAQDTSLLEDREWKSADGQSLEASLVEVKGDWVTLERRRDNRNFKLSIIRLGIADRDLIEKCEKELDQLIKSASGNRTASTVHFVGFSNPDEKVWELARRFGRADALWKQATQSNWFYTPTSGQRVIRLKTERIERISDAEYFIHGQYVSVKVRLPKLDDKLSYHGDRLVRTDSFGRRMVVAQNEVDFLPRLGRENLLSFGLEKVGVVERLVMSVSLRD